MGLSRGGGSCISRTHWAVLTSPLPAQSQQGKQKEHKRELQEHQDKKKGTD